MPSRPSPRCRMSSSVRPSNSGCRWVCANHPGTTRAPSTARPVCARGSSAAPTVVSGRAAVGVGAAAGEQPQEVRLARAVRAEHRDPVAEPHLEVERLHEAGELELLGDDRPLARCARRAGASKVLLRRALLGRPGLLEPAQPRLRGAVSRGEAVVGRRLHLEVATSSLSLACCSSQRRRSSSRRAIRSSRAAW